MRSGSARSRWISTMRVIGMIGAQSRLDDAGGRATALSRGSGARCQLLSWPCGFQQEPFRGALPAEPREASPVGRCPGAALGGRMLRAPVHYVARVRTMVEADIVATLVHDVQTYLGQDFLLDGGAADDRMRRADPGAPAVAVGDALCGAHPAEPHAVEPDFAAWHLPDRGGVGVGVAVDPQSRRAGGAKAAPGPVGGGQVGQFDPRAAGDTSLARAEVGIAGLGVRGGPGQQQQQTAQQRDRRADGSSARGGAPPRDWQIIHDLSLALLPTRGDVPCPHSGVARTPIDGVTPLDRRAGRRLERRTQFERSVRRSAARQRRRRGRGGESEPVVWWTVIPAIDAGDGAETCADEARAPRRAAWRGRGARPGSQKGSSLTSAALARKRPWAASPAWTLVIADREPQRGGCSGWR